MPVDESYPCPKCGAFDLVYEGMLVWSNGPRPPRSMASKEVVLPRRGDLERERCLHCASCGTEYFEDMETRAPHLYEVGGKRVDYNEAWKRWERRTFDPDKKGWVVEIVQPAIEQPPATPQPSTIQLIPGKLDVHVFTHEIPYAQPVPCWTYITRGMSAHGQKELIFTIQRKPGVDQPPPFVLRLIGHIYGLAQQGRLVDAGGYTALSVSHPQSKTGIPFNLLYLPPIPLQGVPLPKPALAVRFMSPEEFKIYMQLGSMRLLSSWAFHARFFPYPPWSELPHPDVVSFQQFQASILIKSPRLHLPQSTVNQEGDSIVLRLGSGARENLARQFEQIPLAQPLALLPGLDPRADACLAWLPEQNQIAMNAPPGSPLAHVAGCFLLFIPEQPAATARMFEDGFALLLPSETWQRLREAIAAGEALTLPTSDKTFQLEQVKGA